MLGITLSQVSKRDYCIRTFVLPYPTQNMSNAWLKGAIIPKEYDNKKEPMYGCGCKKSGL